MVELSSAKLSRAIGEDGASPSFDASVLSPPALTSYDPDFLQRVFGSNRSSSPLNYSGYRSRAFAALAGRVARAPDRATRRRAADAELRLLARELPAVPLFFSEGSFAFRPAIHDGWVFIKGVGILDKRSFLAGGAAPPLRVAPGEGEETGGDAGSSVLEVLRVASLIALAIALVLGAAALFDRLRPHRS